DGLGGAFALAVTPDGAQVYVASGFGGGGDDALAAFDRNATTGALTFTRAQVSMAHGLGPVLTQPNALAVTPDGDEVDVITQGGLGNPGDARLVSRFARPSELVVFDTTTQTFRPGPLPQAEIVATSGTNAVILVPEGYAGGTNLN